METSSIFVFLGTVLGAYVGWNSHSFYITSLWILTWVLGVGAGYMTGIGK